MTKYDAITVLNDVCRSKDAYIISVRLRIEKFENYPAIDKNVSATVALAYLSQVHPALMFGELDIIKIDSASFEFVCAMNNLEHSKEVEETSHYTKEQIEELESENFYAQLCKSSYKPLHHL